MDELFILGLADIFSVYPEIFKNLINKDRENHKNESIISTKKSFIHLPSDPEWQGKVYYRLLHIQKKINSLIESGLKPEDFNEKIDKPKWDPMQILREISPTSTPPTSDEYRQKIKKRCVPDHPIEYIDINVLGTWNLQNISRAAKLLRKPPLPVTFDDEHEMRKVYSLIYDVFRYKHVLSQTLDDVSFFAYYPKLKNDENRVWLMLFELYGRHFLKRHSEEAKEQERLYKEAEIDYISKCLWVNRIRLAAAMARLRIKNGALLLSQLLPMHLQNEKVAIAAANPVVTGWMNPFKLKDKNLAEKALKSMGMTEVHESDEDEDEKPLKPNQYKWDKVCPLFMSCLPNDRCLFAQSDLVRNYYFVMQDRTFSIAPAVLSRLLDHFDLDGDIVQTHVSSPRATAYLAALFHSVNRVKDFIAFGAGQNLSEYKDYIKLLGINNIKLYAENFCNLPLDTPILGNTVGIFATPPNSFSGVADPIDLICSRGGDLSMLAVLTESQISEDGKKRVTQLLEEQRDTLRLAMSRPQVQFVLYETHSIVGSENQDMVENAVEDINQCAFEKHLENYREKIKLRELQAANNPSITLGQSASKMKRSGTDVSDKKLEESNTKQNLMNVTRRDSEDSNVSVEEDYSKYVKVPKTDEFLVSDVPDICINQDKCLNFGSLGCFVSLMHRKEVTKLDAKYLIKMAEARGLFGTAEKRKMTKTKVIRKPEKKTEERRGSHKKAKFKKDDLPLLIERLNQPTHASLIRSNLQSFSSVEGKCVTFDYARKSCLRHDKHNQTYPFMKSPTCVLHDSHSNVPPRAKIWWKDTFKYVKNLNNVQKHHYNQEEKQKKRMNGCFTREKSENGLHFKTSSAECKKNLPPLHLPRSCKEIYKTNHQKEHNRPIHYNILLEKKPFPITINQLEFMGNGLSSRCNYKPGRIYNYPILNGSLCEICKRPRN